VTYDYQPTIEHEDMADDGSQLMDSETVASAEEIAAAVNEDLVNAWEAALVATAEISDALTEVELIECATPGTLTVADLVGLISELPMQHRRGAVFVVNPLMAATLRTLTDGQGKYLWAESLQEGTPARLCGYQVIEDEAVTDGRILFGNPRRGLAVMERQVPTLGNVERSANNYLPYFFGRYAVGRTAAKALKALDVGTAQS
jgi:HK97 family phage major capsid protein